MSKIPVLFIGHGSPMNAIEDNKFTKKWKKISAKIPTPKAILVISAHWVTKGIKVLDDAKPKTTYDMFGFPEEIYKIIYNSPGATELAHRIQKIIDQDVTVDNSWGYDHGNWSVLNHMYPNCDIPVIQLSLDWSLSPSEHYEIGKKLRILRDEGVLIIGSGNIVHNLRMIDWDNENLGYKWADEFDNYIKENILNGSHNKIIDYKSNEVASKLAVPTTEHYYPLLYIIGASNKDDSVSIYNDARVMGSLSMTSYLFEDNGNNSIS
jgi:4,5-DOPA dioxygenase extradiol